MTNIIVSGVFKSGTSSLVNSLSINNKNNLYNIKKIHMGPDYFESTNIILIPIRNQKEIYVSGFFQDIHIPPYIYSIFHTPEDINIYENTKNNKEFIAKFINMYKNNHEAIYNHFNSVYKHLIDSHHLNNSSILKIINKYDDTFKKIPFKKNEFVIRKLSTGCIVVFIDMHMLNDATKINNMLNELNININITTTVYSNNSSDKFYSNEYKTLSTTLRDNNYYDADYYDFLDDMYEIIE